MAQQTKLITGIVKDSSGTGLEGTAIHAVGEKGGVFSEREGLFSINVKRSTKYLDVSLVGYASRRINIEGKDTLVVVLLPQSTGLSDVVVVGVQSQSRKTMTSAVSSLSGDVIENLPAASVDNLLQGRIAGLNVQVTSGEPGVAPTVVVRGNSKINTNISDDSYVAQAQSMSGPLYIIDGIPVNPEDISNTIDVTGTNYLAGININDIESVDVQKDAAATAAWGSRGANGVIYIKTRKGKSEIPAFVFNGYVGATERPKLIKTYTGAEERRLKLQIANAYGTAAQLQSLPQILTDSLNPYYNNATDWQGLFYKSGLIDNVDATVSAASKAVNYRLSMNYYNEDGIVRRFGYTRYAIRGNFDFRISQKLNSQLIVSMSRGDRKRGQKYDNSDDNTAFSGATQPTSFYLLTAFDSSSISGLASKLRNSNINNNYNASFTLNYTIFPELKYTFQGAANITTSDRDYFEPSNIDAIAALTDGGTVQESYAESDRGTFSTYYIANNLNLSKKFTSGGTHDHNVAFVLSQQFTSDVASGNSASGYNVPSNDIQVVSGIPQSDLSASSYYYKDALVSILGQLQYDFDRKYLLSATYRGDGSSRFGANNKWGYFPAVGVGYVLSEEKFMQKYKDVITNLKIRASYGISGNQSSDFYAPYNSYTISGTYNGSTAIQPSYSNGLTKDNLTWARSKQKNIGIDALLFNGRINLTVDAYEKISNDDYYTFTLPFYTGYSDITFNAHDLWVNNRGIDITLNTRNLSPKSAIQWNTQFIMSFNKNIIAKLPNNNRTFMISDYYGVGRIFQVGQPIYEMFQMHYKGVYNHTSDIPFNKLTGTYLTYYKGYHTIQAGDPIWEDVNGDGDVWVGEDNGDQYGDRVPSGNPNPKFFGGFTNDFTYKNFSLSISSVYTWKRTVINTYAQKQFNNLGGSITNFAQYRLPDIDGLDYWTPAKAAADANYKANFPAINPFSGYYYQFWPFTDMWNVDGSYFKVKYVMLGYQVPRPLMDRFRIKGMNLYAMMDNVLIIKNKHNTMPDPEAVDQLGTYSGGLYPQPRKYTFGVRVQF
ncbi:MAG: SusC/RagA family TonB-linked outer membrane protein [Chitinophagaceae bacterium]